jgi:ATP-binding cassette subfamily B protein
MNAHPPQASFRSRPQISAERGALLRTLVHLWPYIWPSDRADLKLRVVAATLLLFVAKLATIAVPFTFKWAVDALTGETHPPAGTPSTMLWVFAAPVLLTVAYGGMRIVMALLTQFRDGLFAKVAMYAVRRLAYRTSSHCASIWNARPAG